MKPGHSDLQSKGKPGYNHFGVKDLVTHFHNVKGECSFKLSVKI